MKKQHFWTLLLLAGLFSGCDLDDPDQGISTDEIIVLSFDRDSIVADGEDRAILKATLGPLAEATEEITFTSERGKLAGSTNNNPGLFKLNASNRVAEVVLQSDNTVDNQVSITAEVGDFKAMKTIRFSRAYPDKMILSPDKVVVDADRIDFSTLTIQLFRDIGVPSEGTEITFETTQLDEATAEIVPFTFSNDNARASVTVKSGNGKPGSVQIKAKTRNQKGTEVSQSVTLEFQ